MRTLKPDLESAYQSYCQTKTKENKFKMVIQCNPSKFLNILLIKFMTNKSFKKT